MSYSVFISFQGADERLARRISQALSAQGIQVFIAPYSIPPGTKWSAQIANALNRSEMVLFLASRQALASPYVAQEIGGAHFSKKLLVPVIWEIAPEELPGWAKEYQALDLRMLGNDWLNVLSQWVSSIKAEKEKKSFYNNVFLSVLAGLLIWSSDDKKDKDYDETFSEN